MGESLASLYRGKVRTMAERFSPLQKGSCHGGKVLAMADRFSTWRKFLRHGRKIYIMAKNNKGRNYEQSAKLWQNFGKGANLSHCTNHWLGDCVFLYFVILIYQISELYVYTIHCTHSSKINILSYPK
jgi:hypothetical protein